MKPSEKQNASNDNNTGIGDAPCGVCGLHAWGIMILLDTQESDGADGFWWRAVDGQQCAECGEPFVWYHKPAPATIELPTFALSLVDAQA